MFFFHKADINAIISEGVICQYGSTWGIGCQDAWESVQSPTKETWSLKTSTALPNDKKVGESALMFQVHPTLTTKHINATVEAISKVMKEAVK